MPLFDFECKSCGHVFEHLELRPQDKVACLRCGGDQVQKLVSLFNCTGVQLTKRLTLQAKEDMRAGQKMLRGQRLRKKRIKIT
ncbi:MAG: zinc ribbon domain-containing protein [Thermodesulfobacteriota bacterium]